MAEKMLKCRTILVPGDARHLLKMGNPIVDIKPKKENPEASVFLFEGTEKFWKDLATLTPHNEEE